MKKIDRKIFLRVRANNKVIIECRDIYVPPKKRIYNYYVKGTTLRTRYNMIYVDNLFKEWFEDWVNHKNAWIGCDTRNKAKRLIASNRQKLKEKENENGNWLKHTISVEKGKPLELEDCSIFEYFKEK